MFVDAALRGQGIGRALLQAIEGAARTGRHRDRLEVCLQVWPGLVEARHR